MFLALAFVLAGAASAETWIVDDDGGPGVDFLDIPPAIAAAAPGDLILLRDGIYSDFILDRGLHIVADRGHDAYVIDPGAEVRNIPLGQRALVAGLTMKTLYVVGCAGTVMVDDCTIGEALVGSALRIEQSALVVVYRTTVRGRDRGGDGGPGGCDCWQAAGAEFHDSTVIVAESSMRGGAGSAIYKMGGTDGRFGLFAQNCALFFQASSAVGGHGGHAYDEWEFEGDGGDGAPGIWLQGSTLELFGLSANEIRGGWGGMPGFLGYWGEDANSVFAENSTVSYSGVSFASGEAVFGGTGSTFHEITPDLPVMTLGGTGQLGGFIEPTLHGPVGASYLIYFSLFPDVTPIGFKITKLLLDPSALFLLTAGTIDATGTASITLPLPVLPEIQGIPIHFQAFVKPPLAVGFISTSAGFTLR